MTDDPTTRLARAAQLIEIGRWEAALTELGPLLAIPETQVEANVLAAGALGKLGQPKEALAHAERAVSLAPNHQRALLALVAAQRMNRQQRQALATLQRAVQLDPHHPGLLSQLAMAHADLGDPTSAHAAAHAAVLADPESAQTHFAMGYATHEVRPDLARIAYRRALEIDPHHGPAKQNLALLSSDSPEVLVTTLTDLLADDPQSTSTRLNLIRQIVIPLWLFALSLLFVLVGLWLSPLLFGAAYLVFEGVRQTRGVIAALKPLGGWKTGWELVRTDRLATILVGLLLTTVIAWLVLLIVFLTGAGWTAALVVGSVLLGSTLAGGVITLVGHLRHKRRQETARWA